MAVRLVIGRIGRGKHRRVGSGRTIQAAISMLPPDIQAVVTAALREDGEDTIQWLGAGPADRSGRARAPAPPPAAVPPYLFVVRSGQVLTFNSLRKLAWARPDLLGVVFDRRWMGERRSQDRPGHAERRCTERRHRTPESGWNKRGFILASSAAHSQPTPTPPAEVPPRLAESAARVGAARAPTPQAVPAPTVAR